MRSLLLIVATCSATLFCVTQPAQAAFTDSVRFFVIDDLRLPDLPADSQTVVADPQEAVARALAGYYQRVDSLNDDFSFLPHPLLIPNPFDRRVSQSARLFKLATDRLRQFGLLFDIAYPSGFAEAEQTTAKAIARGNPVLAIYPQPILLFGYDYREDDPYWYVYRFSPAAGAEIITAGEWRALWWLWEADPTSVILLEITGADITGADTTTAVPGPPKLVLERIITLAKTDTLTGVVSYVRPILRLRDSLSKADELPLLPDLFDDPADPLYLRRAETQRRRLFDYLSALTTRARSSEVQQILRLAIYSASKAAAEFASTRAELYILDDPDSTGETLSVQEIIAERWVEHRLEAADHLAEVLRWEKQMLEALKEITAKKKPFR